MPSVFTDINSTFGHIVTSISHHIAVNTCPAIVVLYVYNGSYRNDFGSLLFPYIAFKTSLRSPIFALSGFSFFASSSFRSRNLE